MNGQCVSNFGDENAKLEQHNLSERPQSLEYNIIGILNFLQNEWVKMGIERSKWEYERAELQNEKKGQENLKNDLVRRIKMLEFALQKERCKNYLLRQSSEIGVEATDHISDEANTSSDVSKSSRDDAVSREERLRLRQYIQKMGLTDKLVEVRANCVKDLLGIVEKSEPSRNKDDLKVTTTTETEPSLAPSAEESDDVEIASALAEFDLLVAQQGECAGVASKSSYLALFFLFFLPPPLPQPSWVQTHTHTSAERGTSVRCLAFKECNYAPLPHLPHFFRVRNP
ncbi:unnamed protein product [Dibothriocephalus latus]|uniref:Striatin N-terminal domain-containing protein n=1 Tax=Dibothriocephalus latus TaxID=60516 RepID=A0A3P7L568_DIBLA|nr:unnamed protein product [Dibothriocephalus latus]